jgi:hypothetical protein
VRSLENCINSDLDYLKRCANFEMAQNKPDLGVLPTGGG